jgi:hypothetical protein
VRIGCVSLFLFLLVHTPGEAADDSAFVARQRRLLTVLSKEPLSLPNIAGRFAVEPDHTGAFSAFDSLGRDRWLSAAFHGYALMGVYLHFRSIFPDSLHRLVREMFRSRGLYRGDTENHWVMYYTGIYLAAQTWPHEAGTEWFNGKSSEENFREAEGWLNHWITLTTTVGQGEFDSPTYMPVFLSPMLLLYDFAADPAMKTRARMMCDLLLADFAVENLRGNYGGGHSRDYPADIINPLIAQTTRVSWLYFGEPEREIWDDPAFAPRVRASWEIVFAALSRYRAPEMVVRMATDRSVPYVHKERKRVRNVIRFGDELNPPVYKYTYMTADYVLGSLQGGILQPFQQHTWDVTYASDKPYNTIFTLHPSYSSRELAMFFPEELNVLARDVDRSKLVYTNPDKWNSSSPYEQTFQHNNVLIVLYNIAPGAQHPHIDGFFPGTLDDRTADSSGWIFCRGGNTAVGLFPLKPYEWISEGKNWRLRSHYLKNGAVVEVASVHSIEVYDNFVRHVRERRVDARNFDSTMTVSYRSVAGDVMAFTYDGPRKLNGEDVDIARTRLYDGPFMTSDVGSGIIELRHGGQTRVLDFQKGTFSNH